MRTLCLAALVAVAAPGFAATPDAGTLSDGNREITYTHAPQPLPNVDADGEYACDVTFPCDEFTLTLDLPADYLDKYPDAYVQVSAASDVAELDIDLQVSDTQGNVVALQRDNPPEQPTLRLYPATGGTATYIVQVVPGTPHAGGSATVTLVPGDEAKFLGLTAGAMPAVALLPFLMLFMLRRARS